MIKRLFAICLLVITAAIWIVPVSAAPSPTPQDADPCPERLIAETETITIFGGWNARVIDRTTGREYFNFLISSPWDAIEPERNLARCPEAVFSADERWLAVSAWGLHIVDTETWEELPLTSTAMTENRQTYAMVWDDAGRFLAFEDAFALHVLDVETDTITTVVEAQDPTPGGNHGLRVLPFAVEFSPDAQWLTVRWGYWERSILGAVNIATGEILFSDLETPINWCDAVIWSPAAAAMVALTCYSPADDESVFHHCTLGDTVDCFQTNFDHEFHAQGWVEGDSLLVSRTLNEPDAEEECFLIRYAFDEIWEPTACDILTAEDSAD